MLLRVLLVAEAGEWLLFVSGPCSHQRWVSATRGRWLFMTLMRRLLLRWLSLHTRRALLWRQTTFRHCSTLAPFYRSVLHSASGPRCHDPLRTCLVLAVMWCCDLAVFAVVRCLSVCLSHVGVLSKQMNGSNWLRGYLSLGVLYIIL